MALLAIKGHETRGKEVIEILEMLGGKNLCARNATDKNMFFTLRDSDDVIIGTFPTDKLAFFTLERFLEKYPYKVGDKVLFKDENTIYFIKKMYWKKDKILYLLSDEDYSDGCSIPDTLIFDVEAEKLQPYKEENFGKCLFGKKETMEEKNYDNSQKWDLPVGYEFQDKEGNVINTDAIKLVKKQPQYPKTYEECCKVMDIDSDNYLSISNLCFDDSDELTTEYERDLLDELTYLWELKICRDAYWKIAGEQMGLGRPWEPMFLKPFLNFPTKEMRDTFFKNFKDLIEKCKTFL